jgi:hypothetical protein
MPSPPAQEETMQTLLLGLTALACPVGMGAMMWMMMRGGNKNTADTSGQGQQQVEQLRTEIDQLRAERATQRTNGGQ